MNELGTIVEQARLFAQENMPVDVLQSAVPFGLVCLVAGIGLSVLGAKLARFGFTCGFVLLGGGAGTFFARELGYPAPITGLIGALMLGVIGYKTFRMWVGAAGALVFASIAIGAFSYQQVLPHVVEYRAQHAPQTASTPGGFRLPTQAEQHAFSETTPKEHLQSMWTFIKSKDVRIERRGQAVALAALITGLLLGVLAVRTALILATSIAGTFLVTTSIGTLLYHWVPNSFQTIEQSPSFALFGVGGFLVASLIVQTLLTRAAPKHEDDLSAKAKAKA